MGFIGGGAWWNNQHLLDKEASQEGMLQQFRYGASFCWVPLKTLLNTLSMRHLTIYYNNLLRYLGWVETVDTVWILAHPENTALLKLVH